MTKGTWILIGAGFILLILIGGFMFDRKSRKDVVPQYAESTRTPGVTESEVLLGSSAAQSGATADLGLNLLSGAKAAIEEINSSGGINGRTLRLISYDDQYDPPQTIIQTQKLINQDKVFALCNYMGTPTTAAILPLLEEAKIPLIGSFTGAEIFRNPIQKYVFNIRASYYQEMELATRYVVDTLNLKRVAIFYQADEFGLSGLTGAKIALEKRNIQPIVLGSYVRGTTDVESVVNEVASSSAQAVIMLGVYAPSAKFIKLVKERAPDMVFITGSFVGPETFAKELGRGKSNIYVTQVIPPVDRGDIYNGVKKYNEALAQYQPEVTPTLGGLEGYVNIKILAEGLKKTGKDITREKFITAMESIQDYDSGIGSLASFSSTNHQSLTDMYLTRLDDFQYVIVPINK